MQHWKLRQREFLHACVDEALHACLHIFDGAEQNRAASFILTDASDSGHTFNHPALEGWVIVQEEKHLGRPANRRIITADVLAVALQHLEFVFHLIWRARHIRRICVLGDSPKSALLAAASDQDRWVRLLDVGRVVRRSVQLLISALEDWAGLAPEELDHLYSLVQALQPVTNRMKGNTEGSMLVRVPRSPQTEF